MTQTQTAIPTINFKEKAEELLPEGASFEACLTCGLCSSGCPASGIENMDPRKFIRMAMLGMDEELSNSKWIWACTQCKRCMHVCPMSIDISELVFLARSNWPQDEKPSGIVRSCQLIRSTDSTSAMGLPPEDFVFVVKDVLEEVRELQPEFKDMQAPMDKKGAHFFVNQNSREPMSEPDEMVPLWKIFNMVGADWTYSSKAWAAENFCMTCGAGPSDCVSERRISKLESSCPTITPTMWRSYAPAASHRSWGKGAKMKESSCWVSPSRNQGVCNDQERVHFRGGPSSRIAQA